MVKGEATTKNPIKMERKLLEEKNMIIQSAKLGVELALSKLKILKDEISQREAYRLWGQSKVKKWVEKGWIKGVKKGLLNSKVIFYRSELDLVKALDEKHNKNKESL